MSSDFIEKQRARIFDKVKEVNARVEQARKRIPTDYHDFLTLIEQNVKIGNFFADQTLRDEFPNLWTRQGEGQGKGQTYLTVALPYVQVDGRVAWFVAEHKAAEKKFAIHTYVEGMQILAGMLRDTPNANPAELRKTIPDSLFDIMTAVVTSELYGNSVGSAKINWKGTGVDSTNPYENAQTSAVGRALGFLGFGLVGTGIASAEEVKEAKAEQAAIAQDKRAAPAEPVAGPTTQKPDSPKSTAAAQTEPAQPVAAVPAQPASAAATDAATTVSEGPCVDCGASFKTMQANAILKRRTNGETVRWSHSAFKNYSCEKAKGGNGT